MVKNLAQKCIELWNVAVSVDEGTNDTSGNQHSSSPKLIMGNMEILRIGDQSHSVVIPHLEELETKKKLHNTIPVASSKALLNKIIPQTLPRLAKRSADQTILCTVKHSCTL